MISQCNVLERKFVFPTADYHNRVILKKINDDCVTRNQCFSFRSCIAPAMFGVCQRKTSCCKKKKKVALSIKTELHSRTLLEISGIVMKDIIQDIDFA